MNRSMVTSHIRQVILSIGLFEILKPLYRKYYVVPAKRRRIKKFQQAALDVLVRFDEVMKSNGYEYGLIFGTLLGAIREGGFLKHDDDIDVAMWNSSWNPRLKEILEQNGFKLIHSFDVDDGKTGREETYICNGVQIDIFFFYEAIDEYPYTCVFGYWEGTASHSECLRKYGGSLVMRYQMPFSRTFRYIEFESIKLPVPIEATKALACTYGDDYMVPKPDWIGGSYKKFRTDWDGKLGIYRQY